MNRLDFFVIGLYLFGLIAMGAVFARKMTNSRQMFAAGGESPWWVSGLSAFMTLFSAGTFVVWGGISYQYGLVGVSILFSIGVGVLFVGRFLAGYWRSLGVESAAEFLHLRFGKSIVQFYTWLQGTLGIFTLGGAVYALAVIVCALVPLAEGHSLADPATGHLSVTIASLGICTVVILITFIGGLWAVLMTDVLQFIILTVSVVMVVPLLFLKTGGPSGFVEAAPERFFHPTGGEFTWWFLAGWSLVHFFKLGGDWAFVQRYLCVPGQAEAKKAAYLFGGLFLISPFFWMLPPMIYRTLVPEANHEQAYILACQLVLPAGMMGLMIAAMSSATASSVTTQLNVYAAALTREVYQRLFRRDAGERELVAAGRVFTLLLGAVVVSGSLLIPRLGTYTGWILATTTLLTGPLIIPTIWGLFSRKIGLATIWFVTAAGIVLGILVKFGFATNGWFAHIGFLEGLARQAQINPRVTDIVAGTFIPLGFLVVAEICQRKTSPGWERVMDSRRRERDAVPVQASALPLRLCGWAVGAVCLVVAGLALLSPDDAVVLVPFTLLLVLITVGLVRLARNVVQ